MNDKYLIFKYGHEAFLPENKPEHYENLNWREKRILHDWIEECLDPCITKNYNYNLPSSYV